MLSILSIFAYWRNTEAINEAQLNYETTQPEYSRTWATWIDPTIMYFSGLYLNVW